MGVIVYCTRCWTARTFHGAWPAKCTVCDRVVRWATASLLDAPRVKWELTDKDSRMLRALWIDPEMPIAGTVEG